jgi:hypothetical protein
MPKEDASKERTFNLEQVRKLMYQAHKAGARKTSADDLGDRNQRLAELRRLFPKVFYHRADAWKTPRQMADVAARKKKTGK